MAEIDLCQAPHSNADRIKEEMVSMRKVSSRFVSPLDDGKANPK